MSTIMAPNPTPAPMPALAPVLSPLEVVDGAATAVLVEDVVDELFVDVVLVDEVGTPEDVGVVVVNVELDAASTKKPGLLTAAPK